MGNEGRNHGKKTYKADNDWGSRERQVGRIRLGHNKKQSHAA